MSEEPTAAREHFGAVAPKFAEVTDLVLFGDAWERPGLSVRDRSLDTVSALIASYKPDELFFHMKRALACSRNRPTDTVAMQKTFFEIFKQHQGEYMGSVLSGWLEGMLPLVKEEGEGIAVDKETFEKGLGAAVKDNDSKFPSEWRMSYKGRAQPS